VGPFVVWGGLRSCGVLFVGVGEVGADYVVLVVLVAVVVAANVDVVLVVVVVALARQLAV
jgi:hypothetical protein